MHDGGWVPTHALPRAAIDLLTQRIGGVSVVGSDNQSVEEVEWVFGVQQGMMQVYCENGLVVALRFEEAAIEHVSLVSIRSRSLRMLGAPRSEKNGIGDIPCAVEKILKASCACWI